LTTDSKSRPGNEATQAVAARQENLLWQVVGEENRMTQTKREPFNAGDFSSRKLMELVSGDRDGDRLVLDQEALDAVVSELASRRHYLRELRDRGLLAPRAS
jgi:hypothetical protein